MSREGGKPGKPRRTIAPDEAELWNRVAKTVGKAKTKPRVPSHADEVPASASPLSERPPEAKESSSKSKKPAAPVPAAPAKARSPRIPPLADFDRRAVRHVAAGKKPIDARIDLHGMRQADARVELRAFLRAAQSRDLRTVLVITGKGASTGERDYLAGGLGQPQRGILRRAVPQWLEEPEMREIVLSYTTAGVRHGGEGALYVQLRKRRGS